MPAWVRYLGGPVGTGPGQDRPATTRLTPGRYVMVCRIISPDGRVHVMKGMIREFEVVAGRGSISDPFPTASDTVTLNDYGFAPAGAGVFARTSASRGRPLGRTDSSASFRTPGMGYGTSGMAW